MTTFEHLSRSHATEAIDTAGRTRPGLTSGPYSVGEFAKQRVDRIRTRNLVWPFTPYSLSSSVSGSILWSSPPLIGWSPAFLRRASANPFGSRAPSLRQAEQKPSGEVVTQQRFEAHARFQGTPTLVGLLVLGHSKASLQSSTPNTRPATLVPCAPCNSTVEGRAHGAHPPRPIAGGACLSSRSTGGVEVPDGRYRCNVELGTYLPTLRTGLLPLPPLPAPHSRPLTSLVLDGHHGA